MKRHWQTCRDTFLSLGVVSPSSFVLCLPGKRNSGQRKMRGDLIFLTRKSLWIKFSLLTLAQWVFRSEEPKSMPRNYGYLSPSKIKVMKKICLEL